MIVFDLETTANGGVKGDSPEAHWLDNKVLLYGFKISGLPIRISTKPNDLLRAIEDEINRAGSCLLIAHNAKFDIKYLLRDHPDLEWDKINVWCTMTWDYLASGHADKFFTLEQSCKKHGIPVTKTLDLGAILAQGVKMEDIDQDTLKDYLVNDVQMLNSLVVEQIRDGYRPFMNHLLPLAEMELNGLPFDSVKATSLAKKYIASTDNIYNDWMDTIIQLCEWQDGSAITLEDFSETEGTKSKCIKPLAERTVSMILTGYPLECKVTQKWRFKLKGSVHPVLSPNEISEVYGDYEPNHLGFPVGESYLKAMQDVNPALDMQQVLDYRHDYKILHTYLLPMLETAEIQGHVYPKLNVTATNTGRLSSSAPNGQNLPPEIRDLIYSTMDQLEEWDFDQLEMVGAACVSGATTLQDDLNNGDDIHYLSGRSVMGWTKPEDMDDATRRTVKNVNFGLLYGGKAKGISYQTGADKGVVQNLINSFYDRHPEVANWQSDVFNQIVDEMYAYDIKNGEQRYASLYTCPFSGRRFHFVETESPYWLRAKTKRKHSFSPNQAYNYPIQGFCGGDIVMRTLYYAWKYVRAHCNLELFKFRMTVHDSILTDHGNNKPQLPTSTMAGPYDFAIEQVEKDFNLPVKLQMSCKSGPTWQ